MIFRFLKFLVYTLFNRFRFFYGGKLIGCGRVFAVGLASWCVAFGPRDLKGLRKLRPRVELHLLRGEGESFGYGAETIRPPRFGDEACIMSSLLGWNGETAVLQVERANRR